MYTCSVNPAHPPTDQRWWIGCHACWVEDQVGNPTRFFTKKHVHMPGDPIQQYVSAFTYNPSSHSLTIKSTGESVVLDSSSRFINYWTASSMGQLYWNKKHQSANWLTPHVGYGASGSWSTAQGRKFTSNLSGILVASVYANPHAFPVHAAHLTGELEPWHWRCACGGLAPPTQVRCLACQQKSSRIDT